MTSEPSDSYIALIDVDAELARSILEQFSSEGISAYTTPADESLQRIHVDRARVAAARAIITTRFPDVDTAFLGNSVTPSHDLSAADVDAAWAQLIDGLQPGDGLEPGRNGPPGSGLSARLVRRHQPPQEPPASEDPPPPSSWSFQPVGGPRDYLTPDDDQLDDLLDDRFIPPEPPPLPRPRDMIDKIAWGGAIGGPVLLVASHVMSWGTWLGGVGVAAFITGFVLLVARMRTERDHDDPGAVL